MHLFHRIVGLLVITVTCTAFAADVDNVVAKDLRIGRLKVNKILILGNSITLHGPAANIGWLGNWGMAASQESKDYVHQLTDRITEKAGGKPQVMVKNIADFERQHGTYDIAEGLKKEIAFDADIIILAIGENVAGLGDDEAKTKYANAYAKLLAELKKRGTPTLFIRSCFWADDAKDAIMKKACEDAGGVFVDIGGLGKVEENYARSERKIEHAGVAAHPGDRGMKAIADAIWAGIVKQAEAEKP